MPEDAPRGRIPLEHGGGGRSDLSDGRLEELVHGSAGGDFRDHHVFFPFLLRHEFGHSHGLDLRRHDLQRVVFAVCNVVKGHALVDVPRFVREVELGHVLLVLALPRLRHARNLRGGGGEDLRLGGHALLGVMAHDLHDAVARHGDVLHHRLAGLVHYLPHLRPLGFRILVRLLLLPALDVRERAEERLAH